MKRFGSRCARIALVGIPLAWTALAGLPLLAQDAASSSAYGESVKLSLLPLLGGGLPVTSGPFPAVGGSAAPAYSRSGSALSVSASTVLTGPLLRTGLVEVSAASGISESMGTWASSAVNNTALSLGRAIPLLSITAPVLRSKATILGDCDSGLSLGGAVDLTGLTLGGSLGLGLTVPVRPAPNTLLLDLGGVRIVLNEQKGTGSEIALRERGITVNALHIYLRDVSLVGLGLVTGDIVLAHSEAAVQCPIGPATDLSLSGFADPDPVAPGGRLTYSLTVMNQGSDTATAVVLDANLPRGFAADFISSAQGSCTLGAPVVCTLGDLEEGQRVEITVEGTVTASTGVLTATASVTSAVTDPDPNNNSLILTTLVDQGTGR